MSGGNLNSQTGCVFSPVSESSTGLCVDKGDVESPLHGLVAREITLVVLARAGDSVSYGPDALRHVYPTRAVRY